MFVPTIDGRYINMRYVHSVHDTTLQDSDGSTLTSVVAVMDDNRKVELEAESAEMFLTKLGLLLRGSRGQRRGSIAVVDPGPLHGDENSHLSVVKHKEKEES